MTVVLSLAELVDSKPLPPIGRIEVMPEDDDGPDRDTETLGYAEGQSFIIEYCDSKGRRSLRRITVYSLVAGAGGVPCLIARCHERKATRQFRIDRVSSCSDFDGVIYDDVAGFFVENFGMSAQAAASGMDQAGEERWSRILESVRADAVILACISRADGSVDPREVEVIQRHIGLVAERAEGMLLNTELLALDRYARRLRPSEAAIVRAIDQLRSKGATHVQRLVRSCVDVMDVDGRRHLAEMSAISSLSQELLGADVASVAAANGTFQSSSEGEQRACRLLNGRGLLRRDPKNGSIWYATEELRKMVLAKAPPELADTSCETEPSSRLPHHALAGLFPMLSEAELEELADDIAERGQQQPIWVWEGHIIDGRNREEACFRRGIEPEYKTYVGADPLGFVLSLNLKRRHLSESQRAMVAAKIVDWERGINQVSAGSANLPTREAARRLSISERAVVAAKRIRDHGAPALQQAIETGKVSVNAGEALSRLEREAQEEVLRREKKEIVARAKAIRAEQQRANHEGRLRHMALVAQSGAKTAGAVSGKFGVIYADPPWQFGVRSEVTGREKSAENHYPTMPTDDICRLFAEIGSPAARDAVLFLWATNPMLEDGLRVMREWGFAYVHHWIWDKEVAGTGYWGRDRHELLLIGRRGSPATPLMGTQPETVHRERKTQHSSKPAYFAERIEALYPGVPALEMFCRSPRPGWTAWGYEASASEASP